MTIADSHTQLIINDQVIMKDDFTKEIILQNHLKLNTIITDSYSVYTEIIEEIGAKHHDCTFQIFQGLMLLLQKHLNKVNRSIKTLEEQIEKTTEIIEQLKNKIPLKRGRTKKIDKKLIQNQKQQKKLKLQNNKNKFKLKHTIKK